ncbi:glutathione peroxidase [Kurthia sibirica]|uniref:Glutathione peroxidase n=1 Tax=Kurthia sibirica TaxID=202750 RepID=A0A2U3ARA4_9BACL|nr:glutathione peroxidase [Kurthia sibirica]PWI26985.1 glutathione peroxidase [Kurthia sibirica]GEK35613.1 glutathione peroxidase [Kurthia sibirica]
MSIYDYKVQLEDGKEYSMSDYKGKAMLIVNTASKCGFTPQFEELEKLYEDYKEEDFVVLGFPTNQFKQEVATAQEAAQECRLNYGVTFPMHSMIQVNGAQEDPLFTYLKDHTKGFLGSSIKWNFTKFLIDKEGNIVGRYASKDKPLSLSKDIEKLL